MKTQANVPDAFMSMTINEQVLDAAGRLRTAKATQFDIEHWRTPETQSIATGFKFNRVLVPDRKVKENDAITRVMGDPRYHELLEAARLEELDEDQPASPSQAHLSGRREHYDNVSYTLRVLLQDLLRMETAVAAERHLQETYEWYHRNHGSHGSTHWKDMTRRQDSPGAATPLHTAPPLIGLDASSIAAGRGLPGSTLGSTFRQPPEGGQEDPLTGPSMASEGSSNRQPDGGRASPGLLEGYNSAMATLPPARERMKGFQTKEVAAPLSARKLRDLGLNATPPPTARSVTPSTATGGFSARSIISARSSPTPVPHSRPQSTTPFPDSRPASAMTQRRPMTVQVLPPAPKESTELTMRPGSVIGQALERSDIVLPPARATPCQHVRNVFEANHRPMTPAEQRMEERWLEKRNREVIDRTIAEEQRAAVRDWAERRARVEEEIARNTETARHQSAFWQRGYAMPPDSAEDIEMTSTLNAPIEESDLRRGPRGSEINYMSSMVPGKVQSPRQSKPQKETKDKVPHYDVRQPKKVGQKVTFSWTGGIKPPNDRPAGPLSARTAHLRKIHQRLLSDDADEAEAAAGDGDDQDEGEAVKDQGKGGASVSSKGSSGEEMKMMPTLSACPPGVEVEGENDSVYCPDPLRLRRPDDSDVLATVCTHWWRHRHGLEDELNPAEPGVTFDEMRFQQLREMEDIKRIFAKNNRGIDAGVLERALVMPTHRIKGAGPELTDCCGLPSNPFAAEERAKGAKKKKKKVVKKKAAGKGGAKSPGPKKRK